MGKILRNGFAALRGLMQFVWFRLTCGGRVSCCKRAMIFHGASLRVAKNSRASIGGGVRIGADATVSVLNGGQLTVGDGVSVGMRNLIVCHQEIQIGRNTILAPNVLIYDHDHVFDAQNGVHKHEFKTKPISIGENCWVGANTVILRGTKIGNNCVIGAGCVVKGEVPDNTVLVQKRTEQMIPMQFEKTVTEEQSQNKSSGGGVIPTP